MNEVQLSESAELAAVGILDIGFLNIGYGLSLTRI